MRDEAEDSGEGGTPATPMPQPAVETLQLFAHDIRAAMSDVLGGLRLVELDRLDPETRTQLDRVRAAGDTLAGLVDAALMAAAGETLIQSDDIGVAVDALQAGILGRWTGRARERGTAFLIEADGPLPARVRVPQVPLDRILGNLIGNALAHAPGGTVTLHIAASDGSGLCVSVHDEGPGFPEDLLTGSSSAGGLSARGPGGGAGLGLRIADELSRQIGGRLHLSNADGAGGAVAALHLPPAMVDWRGDEVADAAPPDLAGLRILVAEDNLTNQMILRQLLQAMGADAVFVSDGVAAVEVLKRDPFDIALIDIEMPRMTGLQVMAHVRALDTPAASMPMVALTAYVLRDNREAIYAAGADGIIGKPIASGAEFGRAILRHAGRPAGLPEPEDVLEGRAGDAGLGCKMDHDRLQALLEAAGPGGAPELLARLEEDLDRVRQSLAQGVDDRAVPVIREQTHILIALAGAVGADRLSALAEVLNIAAKRKRLDDLTALHTPCRADLDDLIALIAARRAALG